MRLSTTSESAIIELHGVSRAYDCAKGDEKVEPDESAEEHGGKGDF